MSEGRVKLLVDRNLEDAQQRLFFIDKSYIEFWLSNMDFVSEYHRLFDAGYKDGFYLFYLTAKNIFSRMKATEDKADICFDFGVAHKSIEEMERRLQVGYDDRNSDPRLDFLVKRLSAPSISVRYWLMVPEFVDAIHAMIPTGVKIDNQSVYPIMRRIYLEKAELRNERKNDDKRIQFSFSIARKAIKAMEERLKISAEERITPPVHY